MKVILLQDVAKIGKKHSVVEVPDGYGMNKLVPRGLVKPATKANMKEVTRRQAAQSAQKHEEEATFGTVREALNDTPITVSLKANPDGALYEAVKADAIIAAIHDVANTTIPAVWIAEHDPIKTVGEHTITLAHGEETCRVTLQVTAA